MYFCPLHQLSNDIGFFVIYKSNTLSIFDMNTFTVGIHALRHILSGLCVVYFRSCRLMELATEGRNGQTF